MNPPPGPPKPTAAEFAHQLRTFFTSLAGYIQARLELFTLETGDAADVIVRRLAWLILGFFFLILGYGLLLAAGVAWLANRFNVPWWETALILSLIHIVIGWFFLRVGKRKISHLVFDQTRKELQKDREWLGNQNPNS